MTKKLLSLVLMALMLLCGTALAETPAADQAPVFDLFDLTVNLGAKSYTFPMSIEQCKEAGINVPEFNPLTEGRYYPNLNVDNGRTAFQIRVECVNGEHWATGCNLTAEKTPNASVGGFTIGVNTRAQLLDALGTPKHTYDSEVVYETFGGNLVWNFYFDGESEDSTLNRITFFSRLPGKFGVEFAEKPAVDETALPDVTSMAFNDFVLNGKLYAKGTTVADLLADGWALPLASPADSTVQGSGGFLVFGYNGYLHNGEDLIYVGAYNYTTEEIPLSECIVSRVEAYSHYRSELILADGITFGCDLSAAEATLGSAASSELREDGGTDYTFDVMGSISYTLTFDKDGALNFIKIQNLY